MSILQLSDKALKTPEMGGNRGDFRRILTKPAINRLYSRHIAAFRAESLRAVNPPCLAFGSKSGQNTLTCRL